MHGNGCKIPGKCVEQGTAEIIEAIYRSFDLQWLDLRSGYEVVVSSKSFVRLIDLATGKLYRILHLSENAQTILNEKRPIQLGFIQGEWNPRLLRELIPSNQLELFGCGSGMPVEPGERGGELYLDVASMEAWNWTGAAWEKCFKVPKVEG